LNLRPLPCEGNALLLVKLAFSPLPRQTLTSGAAECLAHHFVGLWWGGLVREFKLVVIGCGENGEQFIEWGHIAPILYCRDRHVDPMIARDEGGVDSPHRGPRRRASSLFKEQCRSAEMINSRSSAERSNRETNKPSFAWKPQAEITVKTAEYPARIPGISRAAMAGVGNHKPTDGHLRPTATIVSGCTALARRIRAHGPAIFE
jgi:hypothetical protein